jgi:nitric oxide reductase subunit B
MLLFLSTIAIGLFYGAGLMWGRNTHLAMVEYWRWWVVHLWVEGFFEVFATAVIAFLFTKLGLVRGSSATAAVLFHQVQRGGQHGRANDAFHEQTVGGIGPVGRQP